MRLEVPAQVIDLQPVPDQPGRYMGSLVMDDTTFRVEGYDVETRDETTNQLIDELFCFAECGGPLNTLKFGDLELYVVVMPTGT